MCGWLAGGLWLVRFGRVLFCDGCVELALWRLAQVKRCVQLTLARFSRLPHAAKAGLRFRLRRICLVRDGSIWPACGGLLSRCGALVLCGWLAGGLWLVRFGRVLFCDGCVELALWRLAQVKRCVQLTLARFSRLPHAAKAGLRFRLRRICLVQGGEDWCPAIWDGGLLSRCGALVLCGWSVGGL